MPIHLSPLEPLSRRRFIHATAATGIVTLAAASADAAPPDVDPNTFALLADTHIHRDASRVTRGVNLSANLARACKEVIDQKRRPAAALINGDLALTDGRAEDYDRLVSLLKPMREAGVPVHLTLGNHDDRKNFRSNVPDVAPTKKAPEVVEGKHVSVVESPRGNWFLLDSLHQVNKTPGKIGPSQRKWLATALDQRKDKPALVMVHHTPHPGHPDSKFGITDTDALFQVLQSRKHVKVVVFGHAHNWRLEKVEDLHLIHQPPVAYVFSDKRPNGWLRCTLLEGGAELELMPFDKRFEEQGKKTRLTWRG